jgi:Ca-activated chloride channel family protein
MNPSLPHGVVAHPAMFHFASPAYLLLLLALPPLAWLHLRRRRAAVPHPSLALFTGLAVGRAPVVRYGGLLLRLLSLALLAVALAGPRWPDLRTRLDTEGIALMMVVDVSGSMAERDFDSGGEPISRLDAVKRVFHLFVAGGAVEGGLPDPHQQAFEGRPTDLVGLVTFATRPEVACPLTLGHATLFRLLDLEQPRAVPGESETNISDAVTLALARLRAAGPRRKVLVLLTDGEHNVTSPPSGWSPRQAAQVAASLGVPVYTIDAGSDAPTREADRTANREQSVQTLRDLAGITGGRYFAARDTAALVAACRTIDRLERTTIESFQYRRYHEACSWLALASFVFFVLALLLERTLWRRLP